MAALVAIAGEKLLSSGVRACTSRSFEGKPVATAVENVDAAFPRRGPWDYDDQRRNGDRGRFRLPPGRGGASPADKQRAFGRATETMGARA